MGTHAQPIPVVQWASFEEQTHSPKLAEVAGTRGSELPAEESPGREGGSELVTGAVGEELPASAQDGLRSGSRVEGGSFAGESEVTLSGRVGTGSVPDGSLAEAPALFAGQEAPALFAGQEGPALFAGQVSPALRYRWLGTRTPESSTIRPAGEFARHVANAGAGIVSFPIPMPSSSSRTSLPI